MSVLMPLLMRETGLREATVRRIVSRAPDRYKVYTIPKRNGGLRIIAQPAREVKLLQRALVKVLLSNLPVHEAATAYRTGCSIAANAERHALHNGPIIKMDLRNFFPSISSRDWASYCRDNAVFADPEDLYLSTMLLFRREKGSSQLRLSIGAPSSPVLSNVLMFEFDQRVVAALGDNRISYTRYADDLTFSAPRTGYMVEVVSKVAKVVRNLEYPKIDLNPKKTTYVTKKYHRSVTGLTLANDGRVTIGRGRKREISAAVHHASLGKLSKEELRKLAGTLAFVNSVEPEFLDVLRLKYTPKVVVGIQRCVEIPE